MWNQRTFILFRILPREEKIKFFDDLHDKDMETVIAEYSTKYLTDNLEDFHYNEIQLTTLDYVNPEAGTKDQIDIIIDGPYIHVSSDNLEPIKDHVVRTMMENGHLLWKLDVKRPRHITHEYYRCYLRVNPLQEVYPIYYN